MLIADIHTLMVTLAKERPVFHSEADFQHAFAWEMHRRWPEARIRLEQVLRAGEQRMKVDITAYGPGSPAAIELKYPKGSLHATVSGEEFRLSLGVADLTLYDFIRDIVRLELLANTGFEAVAVMLTNDPTHWTASESVYSAALRLPEGRAIQGTYVLKSGEGARPLPGYTRPLVLAGRYEVAWRAYSSIAGLGRGEFRYLALHVPPPNKGKQHD